MLLANEPAPAGNVDVPLARPDFEWHAAQVPTHQANISGRLTTLAARFLGCLVERPPAIFSLPDISNVRVWITTWRDQQVYQPPEQGDLLRIEATYASTLPQLSRCPPWNSVFWVVVLNEVGLSRVVRPIKILPRLLITLVMRLVREATKLTKITPGVALRLYELVSFLVQVQITFVVSILGSESFHHVTWCGVSLRPLASVSLIGGRRLGVFRVLPSNRVIQVVTLVELPCVRVGLC